MTAKPTPGAVPPDERELLADGAEGLDRPYDDNTRQEDDL